MATPLIAFLTPVAAVTRAEIERLAPPGFCLIFAQTHARTEHVQMLARANYAVPAATWMRGWYISPLKNWRLKTIPFSLSKTLETLYALPYSTWEKVKG